MGFFFGVFFYFIFWNFSHKEHGKIIQLIPSFSSFAFKQYFNIFPSSNPIYTFYPKYFLHVSFFKNTFSCLTTSLLLHLTIDMISLITFPTPSIFKCPQLNVSSWLLKLDSNQGPCHCMGFLKTWCIFKSWSLLKLKQISELCHISVLFLYLMRTIPNTDWCISRAVQVEEREADERKQIQLVPGCQWDILQIYRLHLSSGFLQYLKVKSKNRCCLHLYFRILDLRYLVQCALPSKKSLSINL